MIPSSVTCRCSINHNQINSSSRSIGSYIMWMELLPPRDQRHFPTAMA
ncbi:hypothetical protein ACLB1Q_26665 [Escherichia coli]